MEARAAMFQAIAGENNAVSGQVLYGALREFFEFIHATGCHLCRKLRIAKAPFEFLPQAIFEYDAFPILWG